MSRSVTIGPTDVDLDLVGNLLEDLPDVARAVAVAVRRNGPDRVVALVEPTPGTSPSGPQLRWDLSMRVPTYLVPTRVDVLSPSTPLEDAGGIDELEARARREGLEQATGGLPGAIAALWSEQLAVAVTADADFFDLGGDFALARRTVDLIERERGIVLAPSALLGSRTPGSLAQRADRSEPTTTVVPFTADPPPAGKPTVVLTYDMDGSALTLADLAEATGIDGIVGLDLPALDPDHEALRSIAALARHHVDDLLSVHDGGPFVLVGYSLGAVLAYELAVQLLGAGQDVELVGLIDLGPVHVSQDMGRRGIRPSETWPWRPPATDPPHRRLAAYLRHTRELPPGRRFEYLARAANLGRDWDLARAERDLRSGRPIRPELRRSWSWFRLMEAAVAWQPPRLEADVVLFVSDQTAKGNIPTSPKVDYASKLDATLGWSPHVVGDLQLWPVIGCHTDLIEPPYVEGLGREVRRALLGRTSLG